MVGACSYVGLLGPVDGDDRTSLYFVRRTACDSFERGQAGSCSDRKAGKYAG